MGRAGPGRLREEPQPPADTVRPLLRSHLLSASFSLCIPFIYLIFTFLLIYRGGGTWVTGQFVGTGSLLPPQGLWETQVLRLGSRGHWAISLGFPSILSYLLHPGPFLSLSPCFIFLSKIYPALLLCGRLLIDFYLPASMRGETFLPWWQEFLSVLFTADLWPQNCKLTHSRALPILAVPEHIKGQLPGLVNHTFIRSQSYLAFEAGLLITLSLPSC